MSPDARSQSPLEVSRERVESIPLKSCDMNSGQVNLGGQVQGAVSKLKVETLGIGTIKWYILECQPEPLQKVMYCDPGYLSR